MPHDDTGAILAQAQADGYAMGRRLLAGEMDVRSNPYRPDEPEHAAWRLGWMRATQPRRAALFPDVVDIDF